MAVVSLLQVGVLAWGLATGNGGTTDAAQPSAEATARAAQARFQALDVNHDGVVSRYEYDSEIVFEVADTDHDGLLTAKELDAAIPAQPDTPSAAKRMLMADLDNDGALDDAELRRAMAQRFDWLDRNHDGNLDQAEFQAGYGVRVRP